MSVPFTLSQSSWINYLYKHNHIKIKNITSWVA
jgi:hypothetical protein